MSARDEALNAIEHVAGMLARPEFSALDRKIAIATLEHAKENVALIQELKRARKAKGA